MTFFETYDWKTLLYYENFKQSSQCTVENYENEMKLKDKFKLRVN